MEGRVILELSKKILIPSTNITFCVLESWHYLHTLLEKSNIENDVQHAIHVERFIKQNEHE